MKHLIPPIIMYLMISITHAQSDTLETQTLSTFDQESIENKEEKRLKEFLKVEDGTKGWFNSFVSTLYNKGETVAKRGQVDNYLWSNKNMVAFHFFTYGGGSNTHYITCVDSNGSVMVIEHILTQNLKLDNYYNVDRYAENQILVTDENPEMHLKNVRKSAKDKTYVKAIIYGIDTNGKITKTPFN